MDEVAPNVGITERWVSVLAGSAMLLTAKKRPDLAGPAAGPIGADLIERGLTGWCRSYAALGIDSLVEGTAAMSVQLAVAVGLPKNGRFQALLVELPHVPRLARFVKLVERLEDRRARLVGEAPFGTRLEWIAEADESAASVRIAWRSMPRSIVMHQGGAKIQSVSGAAEAEIDLRFMPLAGAMGLAMGKVLDDLRGQAVVDDLEQWRRFAKSELLMGIGKTQGQVRRADGRLATIA